MTPEKNLPQYSYKEVRCSHCGHTGKNREENAFIEDIGRCHACEHTAIELSPPMDFSTNEIHSPFDTVSEE